MKADLVGLSGPVFPMDIELGKVREFSRAVQAPDDAAEVSPATFLVTMESWEPEGSNPMRRAQLDPSRSLYAEQEFVFTGPPPMVGAYLTVQQRITDVVTKPGRRGSTLTFVTMESEFRDPDDKVVARSIWTEAETSQIVGG